jgi:uncharacterized repeat protein (TIGR01451 family)
MQELVTLWSSAASSGAGALSPRHSRTGRVLRALLVLVWVVAIFLASYQVQPVSAQGGVGYAEYYVMGDEAHIFAALDAIPNSSAAGSINSRLSIVSSADDVNVYLDEWEDGYDFDPSDPSNTADARWDVAGGSALNQGDVLTLTETDTFVAGSQGVDGGDRLYITGAPVSVVRTVWPDTPGPYLAGSWELYPVQAWQNSYTVPVGEDLDSLGDPFEYTFLFIQAMEDNTQVVVTDPVIGERVNTLINQGDNIYVDHVNSGTTVTADGPIQAGLITSVNGVYDSRYYTLTPQEFLGNEYYLPVPSMRLFDGELPARSYRDIDTAAYIYAFQDGTVVTIETSTGTQTTTLNAGEVYRYLMPRAPAGTIQGPYGAHVTANNKIWILVAGDDDRPDLDWGYQALNPQYLGDHYHLPFAPANPAHITPVDDNTTFFVSWEGHGVVDETFTLDRFETRMLFDPDQDATGAHIYATGPFAMAWGQDNTERTPGEPLPDYDYGYTVLPPDWFDPVLTIEKTVDPPTLPAEGGAVQYTLVVATENEWVYNIDVSDTLPPGWRYVNGTTTITFSDGTPSSNAEPAGAPGPDLLWELDHNLGPYQSITVIFSAETIPGAYSAGFHLNWGQAYGTSTEDENDPNAAVFRPEDHALVYIPNEPYLNLDKTSSVEGVVEVGDEITYTICFSNSGLVAATGVVITDLVPANTMYMTGSVTGPAPPIAPPPPPPAIEYRTETGDWVSPEPLTVTGLRWNIGELVTGTTHCVSFQVQVTTQAQGINNIATIDSNETDPIDDPAYNPLAGREPPEPEPSDSDEGPESEPPPAPTPIPPTPVPPTPTVEVVTVARLPETGGFPGWFTLVLGVPLVIGVAGLLNLAVLGMRARRGDGK